MAPRKEFDWFDRPESRKLLWRLLYGACGLTVLLELFLEIHPHFGFDGFIGFSALLGFASCAVLILFAKLVGVFLKRKVTYYGE